MEHQQDGVEAAIDGLRITRGYICSRLPFTNRSCFGLFGVQVARTAVPIEEALRRRVLRGGIQLLRDAGVLVR